MEFSNLIKFVEIPLRKNKGTPVFAICIIMCKHAITKCWTFHKLVHRIIKEGTLELSQPKVQRNPFPNHKGKGIAIVVICVDSGANEEERPALPTLAITILQKSSQFKNLFDQLELMTDEQRIATKALVGIASRAGIEWLETENRADKAFLQDTNEIIFCDEDMEVGYLNHKRPLYLAAYINQISIKRALVDTGTSVNLIPLYTLQAAGIPKSKI